MSAASILSLPLHIVCNILKNLGNAKSLQAAIASHSIFYRTLKEYEVIITRDIIDAEISPSLYPYALAAYAIRSQPSFDYEYICNVLYDMQYRILRFPSRGKVDFRCLPSLRAAVYISKLHEAVLFFTRRIGKEVLFRGVADLGLERTKRNWVSVSERFIIKRALYRFQIYSELVLACDRARDASGAMPTGVFTDSFVKDIWLGPFPPWVNEQLASVYDYLRHFTTMIIDRVAQRDVEWGARRIEYLSKCTENPYTRGFVTHGLLFLLPLNRCEMYRGWLIRMNAKGITYCARGLDEFLENCIDWTLFGLQAPRNTSHFSDETCTRIATALRYRTWEMYCKRMDAKFSRKNVITTGEEARGPHAFCEEGWSHLAHEEVDDVSRFPCQAWKRALRRCDIRKSVNNSKMHTARLSGYVLLNEPESEFHLLGPMGQVFFIMAAKDHPLLSERLRIEEERESWWANRSWCYKQGTRGYISPDAVCELTMDDDFLDEDAMRKLRNDYKDMTIPREPEVNSDAAQETL